MSTKIISGNLPLVKVEPKGPCTFFDAQEFALSVAFMAKTSVGKSILIYDINVVGASDVSVVSQLDANTIRIEASTASIGGQEVAWPQTDLDITIPSYSYILFNNLGNITVSESYIENYGILAIVTADSSSISDIFRFINNGKYIMYKSQVDDNGTWVWDSSNTKILSSGKNPRFKLDDDNNLELFYEKNGQVFKRNINVFGDIVQFQYNEDYPLNVNTIRPDDFIEYGLTKVSTSKNISTIKEHSSFYFNLALHGLAYDSVTGNEIYKVRLPSVAERLALPINFKEYTHYVIYDENYNELERIPFDMNFGQLYTFPVDGNTYRIGLSGSYSQFNNRIRVEPIFIYESDHITITPTMEPSSLRALQPISVSTEKNTFAVTKTYSYLNQTLNEDSSVWVSSVRNVYNVTKTYEYINSIKVEPTTVSCATTHNIFTIN